MKKLVQYLIKYPAWERIILLVLLGFGAYSLSQMKTAFFPEREPNTITIQLVYPGSTPEEIEEGAVLKIEDKLRGIAGIERSSSQSMENMANITIEVFSSYDVDEVLEEVKNAVNSINSFPTDMEPPLVYKSKFFDLAMSVAISGDVNLKQLKETARIVEDDLMAIEGITQVELSGFPEEEIVVNVRENDLRNYNLTFEQIAMAMQRANFDLKAGSIKTKEEELTIVFRGKEFYADGFRDVVVKSMPDGMIVRLSDVADIEDRWAESPVRSYVNGEASVIVTVKKTLEEDIIDITDKTKAYFDNFNEEHEQLTATVIRDATKSLRQRIQLLTKNGAIGFLLVLLSLTLFINIRLAFWVGLSIPISFAGMFIFANFFDVSINVISLFGMIIVVGILVDDSIIVGENVFQHAERGKSPIRAAIDGAVEVFPSILAAILTTVLAFSPFFFMEGRMGRNMPDMAFVVIFTILFSLFEASLLLPVHLAYSKGLKKKEKENKVRTFLNKRIAFLRDRMYAPSLKFFMYNKFLIIAVILLFILVTAGAYRGGVIRTTFFPNLDSDWLDIDVVLKPGTSENITKEVLDHIEDATVELNQELKNQREDGKDIVEMIQKNIATSGLGVSGPHTGSIRLILLDGEERNMQSMKFAALLREKVGDIPIAEQISYGGMGHRFGKPISISLVSSNLDHLKIVKDRLKAEMKDLETVRDVMDNDLVGAREVNIELKDKAYMLGLNEMEVMRQIRQGFFGYETQRVQRGRDEVKIWVRYDREDRSSLAKLEDMRIRLPNGNQYPLSEIADYEIQRTSSVINHLDGKRVIRVDADLADPDMDVPPILNNIQQNILSDILAEYPTVRVVDDGQKRELNKTMTSTQRVLPLALIGMFVLIVLGFRSFYQAMIVILLIPLGFIGILWGHFVHGMPVSIMSYYGLIALMGIIVNDSIVFVNAFNIKMKDGMGFYEAVYQAGLSRFRPIILTTVTTIFGLAPLIFEKSFQAQFLVPMAVSVAYGLLFASLVILIMLPVFIIILNKVKVYLSWAWNGKKPAPEEVEPAYKERKRLEKDIYKFD